MRDTIDLIREAGIDEWWSSGGEVRETFDEYLKAFEAIVRADEREACAKVCEDLEGCAQYFPHVPDIIRNRGNT